MRSLVCTASTVAPDFSAIGDGTESLELDVIVEVERVRFGSRRIWIWLLSFFTGGGAMHSGDVTYIDQCSEEVRARVKTRTKMRTMSGDGGPE